MAFWLSIAGAGVVGIGVLALVLLALASRRGQAPGLVDGRLAPCPASPNCVCSESATAADAAVAPIPYKGSVDSTLETLKQAIIDEGGKVVSEAPDYLAATFSSRVFGFVDDMEIRVTPEESVLHVRSSSRVGYSDLGRNRKRVEALTQRFQAAASQAGLP